MEQEQIMNIIANHGSVALLEMVIPAIEAETEMLMDDEDCIAREQVERRGKAALDYIRLAIRELKRGVL